MIVKSFLLLLTSLFLSVQSVQGQTLYKHNATVAQLEESWAWLSGGVSFFLTGILLIIVYILLFFTIKSLWSNIKKREDAQIQLRDPSKG